MLSNWSQAEAALETTMDAAGSATKENETYLDSINGKIAIFKASLQELSTSVFDFDAIKVPIEIGTGAVDFIDNMIVDTDKIEDLVNGESTFGETFNAEFLDPIAENLEIIGNGLEAIPETLQTIFKLLKTAPALIGAISVAATATGKDLGK